MSRKVIPNLYSKYIKGTEKNAIVQDIQALLCNLTNTVIKGIKIDSHDCRRVYISTRVLKHIYDKRPAEEFDFLVENAHGIVKYPNRIYKNKNGKRGSFCFIKQIKNIDYICSVQLIMKETVITHCEVVTFFRIQKENYLSDYELLWEWKGGEPSS